MLFGGVQGIQYRKTKQNKRLENCILQMGKLRSIRGKKHTHGLEMRKWSGGREPRFLVLSLFLSGRWAQAVSRGWAGLGCKHRIVPALFRKAHQSSCPLGVCSLASYRLQVGVNSSERGFDLRRAKVPPETESWGLPNEMAEQSDLICDSFMQWLEVGERV